MYPFAECFNDSFVEPNLGKMFSVEYLGLSNEDPVSDYDKELIEQFEMSINHKGDCYYVKFWDGDKNNYFSFNRTVALNVLNRLDKKVKQNMYE